MNETLCPTWRVACVQMCSDVSWQTNMQHMRQAVAEAATNQAQCVLLPEYFTLIGSSAQTQKIAEQFTAGPIQTMLSDCARTHGVWLLAGSIPLQSSDPQRSYNASLLFDPQGVCQARYDKINLFKLEAAQEAFDETQNIYPGHTPVMAATPFGLFGLSICFDIRFPELYQHYLGARVITLPSAFALTTGRAHWHVLLRARAIEMQAYVLAPAQCGTHASGRKSYGHSLMIDPWGNIMAEADGATTTIIYADLKQSTIDQARSALPALKLRQHAQHSTQNT